jgi:hypothetical protein
LKNNVGRNYLFDVLIRIITDFWLAHSQNLRVASIDLTISAKRLNSGPWSFRWLLCQIVILGKIPFKTALNAIDGALF